MAALSLELREKRFPAVGAAPAKLVLDNVRLAVAAGERLAIIGPSGCGKTTLLNIVAGLERTFAGRLELAAAHPARLRLPGAAPAALAHGRGQSAPRPARDAGPDGADRRRPGRGRARAPRVDVYASRLSLGMARRAALARAFVVEPSLLLLDDQRRSRAVATRYRADPAGRASPTCPVRARGRSGRAGSRCRQKTGSRGGR